jgi:hypothetical protein
MPINLPVSPSIPSLVSTIDFDSADSYGEETIVFDDRSHCDPLFLEDVAVPGPGSTDTAMDFGSLVDWDTISAGEVEIVFYNDNEELSEEPAFGKGDYNQRSSSMFPGDFEIASTDCVSDLTNMSEVAHNDGESVPLIEEGSLHLTQGFVVEHHDGGLAHALLLDKPVDSYLGRIPDSSHVPYFDVAIHSVCRARDFGFKSVRFKSLSTEPAASLTFLLPSASSHMVPWWQQAIPVPQVPTVGTRRFGFKDRNEERIGSEGDVDDSLLVDIIMRQFTTCIQDQVLQHCMGSDSSPCL